MAFFHAFYEPLARIPAQPLVDFAKWLSTDEAHSLVLNRNEFCFEAAGKLICPLHQGVVQNEASYGAVQPIVQAVQQAGIRLLADRQPFRIEVSLIKPGGEVTEHQDQHLMHLLCERIHVPVVTDNSTCFYSRWFTDKDWTAFMMPAGGIYRLNNRVPHKVKNASPRFRVHVIIDYIRHETLEQYRGNLEELDDRYMITTTSDSYWYRAPVRP
jgi:hypothetical protein